MKSIFSLILALFLFSTIVTAQEETKLPTDAGRFALQFRVAENFQLSTFQGGIFSGKYYIADNHAIRLGISASVQSSDNHSAYEITDETKSDQWSFTVSSDYLAHIARYDDVSLYTGGGLVYRRYLYSETDYQNESGSSWGIGAQGFIGVEWFFRHNMSLSAEYGMGFNYQESTSNRNGNERPGNRIRRTFGARSAQFGLSVYL